MLSRLAGLAVLVPAAAVGVVAIGVAAVVPAAAVGYGMALQRWYTPDFVEGLPLPARLTEPTEQVAA
jgi:hypothetical protein